MKAASSTVAVSSAAAVSSTAAASLAASLLAASRAPLVGLSLDRLFFDPDLLVTWWRSQDRSYIGPEGWTDVPGMDSYSIGLKG